MRLLTLKKGMSIVIKVGSSLLATPDGGLSTKALEGMAKGLSHLRKNGMSVTLVTSGAVACGMKTLGFRKKPHLITELQACAAVGQPLLMQMYQKALGRHRLQSAQVLLTRDDLSNRRRYLNARLTLTELLKRAVIPIINENDTVVVDEIRVGDNDNLSALVAALMDADLLVLLTDQEGFYTADPRKDPAAKPIAVVDNVDENTFAKASDTGGITTVGGMKTKLEAARKAAEFGIPTIIASGHNSTTLVRLAAGEETGTLFLPKIDSLTARKHWIAHSLKPAGSIRVDDGAARALIDGKKSLLPTGIRAVEGDFESGDAVSILTLEGTLIGRGLTSYGAREVEILAGKKSSEIEPLLGYKGPAEVVHRDNMVLT